MMTTLLLLEVTLMEKILVPLEGIPMMTIIILTKKMRSKQLV